MKKLNGIVSKYLLGICLLCAGAFVPQTAWGQGTTATLSGTVQDANGAVIPNAGVELKNQATGDTRHTKSNSVGLFSFSALPSGDYDVQIDSPGFKPFRQTAIHLDPGDSRTIRDLHLSVGVASDEVTVTEAGQIISLDSGESSSLISSEDIKHLSVEGRDVTELFKILPGFAINNGTGSIDNKAWDPSQVTVRGAGQFYSSNGTLQNSVSELMDGVDITDPGDFGGALQNMNYDQIAEVKVETSSFTADGAHGPVVVNAIGKSGGAQYHGSIYTYARTSQLNSTDWLANHTGQLKPPDRQVYPGLTFGGPVLIPGTRFNRDQKKLTFFIAGEQYAQRNAYAYGSASSAILTALVPTAAMRTGDFSAAQLQQYLGPNYTPKDGGPGCTGTYSNICYVPQTGPQGQPLVNGNIGAFIDPGARQLINTMPLPNVASNGTYNWITTNLDDNNLWQSRGRVDYAISDKNKISVVYSTERGKQGFPQIEYYSPRGPMGGINTPGGGLLSTIVSESGSLNFVSVASPSLTNEFSMSGAWLVQNFVPKSMAATQGGTGYVYGGLWNNNSRVLPQLSDYGNDGLPLELMPDATYGGIYAKKWVPSAADNLTKVIGAHTLRTGVFFQKDNNHQVIPFVNTNGSITQYYQGETINDANGGTIHNTGTAGNGGNYLADFMEGHIFGYSQTNIQPAPNLYFYNIDWYAQDHWRLNRRLTLDLGVRLEHLTPWADSHGQGVPVFDPATYKNPVSALLPGFRWNAVDKSVPLGGLATRWAYIEPRAGFAWDMYGQGNTVLRGGFGIYRSHDSSNDDANAVGTVLGQRSVSTNGAIALSQISTQAAKATSASAFVPDSDARGFMANDDQQPQTFTWNLAIDQRIPGNSFLQIAYVGNHSNHLLNNGSNQNTNLSNINSLPIGALFGPQPGTGTIFPLLAPPGSNVTTVGGMGQHNMDQFKPYPLYNHLFIAQHNVYSNYDGLQISWTKQQSKLHYGINYTFSKALGVFGAANNGTPTDPFNVRNDYQNEPFDHRHIFNASYSYDFGQVLKGHRWLGSAVNGWEISGITNIQSGSPLPATASPNFGAGGTITLNSPPGVNGQQTLGISNTNLLGTPDVTLQPTLLCNPASGSMSHQYLNAACFGLNPTVGQNGAYRFGFLPGPAFTNSDLTLSKRFNVTEKSSIQFRAAAFNFLNHANTSFTGVVPGAFNLNFNGTYTGQSVSQALAASTSQNPNFGLAPLRQGRRIMELALRFDF